MPARLLAIATLLALLMPTPASAKPADWVFDEEDDPSRFDLSLLGSFSFDLSVGGSAVLGFAIAPKGFIPNKNDAFFIEVDGGASHRLPGPGNPSGFGSAHIGGGVRYQLHILKWLAPYVAVRGGARFWFDPDAFGQLASPYVSGAFGAFFYPAEVFALRVEIGFPGFRGGIAFYF